MSHSEFWNNIDTIIAQGFNAQGLKQLEEYAELFISGRLIYKRFSPLEQHGCSAGGSNHVIASLLAGASIDPSSLSAPEGIKSIGLDYYILPILALDRISLHNAYFPETRLKVLGFGRTSEGDFQVIVEQAHIQGEQMADEEIQQFAEKIGFQLRNPRNWTYTTPEIYLSDLHDENVIRSVNGNIFVIDCDIRLNTPDLKLDGIRELTTEVEFT